MLENNPITDGSQVRKKNKWGGGKEEMGGGVGGVKADKLNSFSE